MLFVLGGPILPLHLSGRSRCIHAGTIGASLIAPKPLSNCPTHKAFAVTEVRMGEPVLCTKPECQTTAGCRCRTTYGWPQLVPQAPTRTLGGSDFSWPVTTRNGARHVISRCLDENCDQLHPEQARRIIAALEGAGYEIVPK